MERRLGADQAAHRRELQPSRGDRFSMDASRGEILVAELSIEQLASCSKESGRERCVRPFHEPS
jgi:hypothetical protein